MIVSDKRFLSIFLLSFLFCCNSYSFAQKIVKEYLGRYSISELNTTQSMEQLSDNIITAKTTAGIFNLIDKLGLLDKLLKQNKPDAILFFNGKDGKNETVLLNKEHEIVEKLVYANTIAIIWFDDVKDNNYQLDINVERQKSSLLQDLKAFKDIFGVLKPTGKSRGELQEYYLAADLITGIGPAPSTVKIDIKQLTHRKNDENISSAGNFDNIITITENTVYYFTKTSVEIKNVEIRYFALTIGVAYSSSNEKLIEPDVDKINVLQVKNGVSKDWKGNAMIMISLLPGIESDFAPSGEFWTSNFYEKFWCRFSLNVGFQISERPFDKLFLGLGFRVTDYVDLLFGINFTNQPENNSSFSLSKVSSFSDLSKILPYHYENGTFFGLAIQASKILKML